MESNNSGGWKQRKIETLTCPSGEVVQVRRPGPEFMLRSGKIVSTFSRVMNANAAIAQDTSLSTHERGLQIIANMSDEELGAVMIFARELVCAMLVSPRLVQSPRPGTDEIGPDDIGDDFWWLFAYAMGGYFGLPVPVGDDQEVSISDLESFRTDEGVPRDSNNSADVRPDTEQPVGDQGLEHSA
jgi:hypothetical protein